MPRIRTIKPEFPDDETLGAVSRDARLTFVLVWTRCDDHGRFRAAPAYLRAQLFPYDEDLTLQTVAGWVDELARVGRLNLYEVDGQRYGEVVNWAKHQRIDNAGKELVPPPPVDNPPPRESAGQDDIPPSAESCGEPPLDLDPDLDLDRSGERPPTADRLAAALELIARQRLQRTKETTGVNNDEAWLAKTRLNLAREKTTEGRRLLATYPEISASQLAGALEGETRNLRLLRRVEAAAS